MEPSSERPVRYFSALQVCGTLAVMAFHAGVAHAAWGWIAVILFFTLAGGNMVRAVERSESMYEYGRSRLLRLAFPITIVWCYVGASALVRGGTTGAHWFLVSSPVFLQNLTLPFFQYQFPQDWSFGPLWFVGALLQLQLGLFAFRKLLARHRPLVIVGAVMVAGIACRWLTAIVLGGTGREVDGRAADVLYVLPFTHIEAMTLGFLVRRGALPGLGRHLATVSAMAFGVVLIGRGLPGLHVPMESLGLDFPLRVNYMHVWGYSVLALAAASLCSLWNPVAEWVQTMTVPAWFDASLSRAASLSYCAYVFHGSVLTSTQGLARWLTLRGFHSIGPTIFVSVVSGSFALAAVALSVMHAIERSLATGDPVRKRPSSAPTSSESEVMAFSQLPGGVTIMAARAEAADYAPRPRRARKKRNLSSNVS